MTQAGVESSPIPTTTSMSVIQSDSAALPLSTADVEMRNSTMSDDNAYLAQPDTSMPQPPEPAHLHPETTAASTTHPSDEPIDTTTTFPSAIPPTIAATTPQADPVCIINFLLTTGARHEFRIDEKYLAKRNVQLPGLTEDGRKDPFSISVYTLKELIMREWRAECEVKPPSPASIRLIHFGRLLDDKLPLKECRFNKDTPNVVHMTVRPADIIEDEEATKTGSRDRSRSESTAGCRCVIL